MPTRTASRERLFPGLEGNVSTAGHVVLQGARSAAPAPGRAPLSRDFTVAYAACDRESQSHGKLSARERIEPMNNMIGESWVTTKFEALEDWAQRNSFWPFPFGTACCAIEF